jgi:hypothetical protein
MHILKGAPLLLALALLATGPASADKESDRTPGGWIERMCAPKTEQGRRADWMQRRADRLAERLNLNDAQKAALKDLEDTRAKLRDDHKTALCAAKPDLSTFEARLNFRQTMMENRLADMKATNPKLLAFYNSLNDYQKGEFDAMRARGGGWRQRDRG